MSSSSEPSQCLQAIDALLYLIRITSYNVCYTKLLRATRRIVDRLDNSDNFAGAADEDVGGVATLEDGQLTGVNPTGQLHRIGGFGDPTIRLKDTHPGKARIASDRFENGLDVTGVTDAHGTGDGPLDDRQNQFRRFLARFGDVAVFATDVQKA